MVYYFLFPSQSFCLENRILPSKLLPFILKKCFSFQMIFCVDVKRKRILLNLYTKQVTTGQWGVGYNFFTKMSADNSGKSQEPTDLQLTQFRTKM